MFETNIYRTQHFKLMSVLDEAQTLIDVSTLASNATRVRSLLGQFASLLSVHLYLEDHELYPVILDHRDPAVRAKARAYVEEMGDLIVVFKTFLAKYHSTVQIKAAPAVFVQESQALFLAVTKRIVAEEKDLFVMLEGLSL